MLTMLASLELFLAAVRGCHLVSVESTAICWCQPRLEEIPPDGELIVHRRLWDQADA